MKSLNHQFFIAPLEIDLYVLKFWYIKFEKEISEPICIDNRINPDQLLSNSEDLLDLLQRVNFILANLTANNKMISQQMVTLAGYFVGCEIRLKLKLASIYMLLHVNNIDKADFVRKAQLLNNEVRFRLNYCSLELPFSVKQSAKISWALQFIDIVDTIRFSGIPGIQKILQEIYLTKSYAKKKELFTEAIDLARQTGDSELIFSLLMQKQLSHAIELDYLTRQGFDELYLGSRKELYL